MSEANKKARKLRPFGFASLNSILDDEKSAIVARWLRDQIDLSELRGIETGAKWMCEAVAALEAVSAVKSKRPKRRKAKPPNPVTK